MLPNPMSAYKVQSESEENGCWIYEVDLRGPSETMNRVRLRLAWEDYDLWVRDGSIEPARVADSLIRYVLKHDAFDPPPSRIDSSHPRRLDEQADEEIGRLIRDQNA